MTIDELTPLLETWYETAPDGLGLGAGRTADVRNPILRTLYARLGALAEVDAPWWRAGGQDTLVSLQNLRREDELSVFGVENQGNFVIAAPDSPNRNIYGKGDGLAIDRITAFTDLGVPLEECIVTFVLREVIFTAQPLLRRASPATVAAAKSGNRHRGRYICDDEYTEFWLSSDVWLMEDIAFGESLVAPKGAWRRSLGA